MANAFRGLGFTRALRAGREEARENARLGLAEKGLALQQRGLEAEIRNSAALLDLKRQQGETERQLKIRDFVNAQVTGLTTAAEQAVKAGNGEQFLAFIASDKGRQVLAPIESAIQSAGLGINLRDQIVLKVLGSPSPEQVAANEALKEGATTGARLSVESSPAAIEGAASRAGAIKAAETAATGGNQEQVVRLTMAKREALLAGDKELADNIQGRLDALISSPTFDPRLQQKIEAGASGAERQSAQTMSRLGSLLDQVRTKPGVAGMRGTFTEKAGGILGQIAGFVSHSDQVGKSVESGVAEFFSDATPEEVNSFRTEARKLVSELLPSITNENSRFTDTERKLARDTARLLESDASPTQVVSSLKTLLKLEMAGRIRADQQRAQFGANKLDIVSNEDDQLRIARDLVNLGLSVDEAANFVEQMVNELMLVK